MSEMNAIDIWPEPTKADADGLELAAIVEAPGIEARRLWYRLPLEDAAEASTTHDHLLVATLFFAMKTADRITVHGAVSRSLLENLEEFTRAWHCWRPTIYGVPVLAADEVYDRPSRRDRAICAFSGGVDACCALVRHVRGQAGRRSRRIAVAALVHGFDLPLADTGAMRIASASARQIVGSLGVPLRVIATNSHELLPQDWEDSFFAQAVAAMMTYAGGCDSCVIGGCEPYSSFVTPWGSNPVTNPLLSSNEFAVITDGLELGRVNKVGVIASWPEARRSLRVCWQAGSDGGNCGLCEKCIRTRLEFMCHGIDRPECFPNTPLTGRDIRAVRARNPAQLVLLQEILDFVDKDGKFRSAPWVAPLRSVVRRGVLKRRPGMIQFMRKQIALRSRLRRLMGTEDTAGCARSVRDETP